MQILLTKSSFESFFRSSFRHLFICHFLLNTVILLENIVAADKSIEVIFAPDSLDFWFDYWEVFDDGFHAMLGPYFSLLYSSLVWTEFVTFRQFFFKVTHSAWSVHRVNRCIHLT